MAQVERDVMRTHPDMHFFTGDSEEAEMHREVEEGRVGREGEGDRDAMRGGGGQGREGRRGAQRGGKGGNKLEWPGRRRASAPSDAHSPPHAFTLRPTTPCPPRSHKKLPKSLSHTGIAQEVKCALFTHCLHAPPPSGDEACLVPLCQAEPRPVLHPGEVGGPFSCYIQMRERPSPLFTHARFDLVFWYIQVRGSPPFPC